MAIQLASPILGTVVNTWSYVFSLVGDGSSTTLAVDFKAQFQGDPATRDQAPSAISSISTNGGAVPTGTLSGTVVTLVWPTPVGAGVFELVTVSLIF